MRKYIDADKLEKDGWSMQRIRQASPTEMVYETKKPTDFPAADVEKVRHGHWFCEKGDCFPKCSVCGQYHGTVYEHYYCPICGAKMDEVRE